MKLLKIHIIVFSIFSIMTSCLCQRNSKYNDLINETSIYLLDHRSNPVNWMPYSKKAINKAIKEDKLIVISIGYSSCHWCHVMEKETFSDDSVAEIMNNNFISIKVDKEELPDIDKMYMTSAQLMNQNTGWPLNCIALSNGTPIWCGTYFKKNDWIELLNKINDIYRNNRQLLEEGGKKIYRSVREYEKIKSTNKEKEQINKNFDNELHDNIYSSFDQKYGGINTSPKFIIPSNYDFMMTYFYAYKKQETLKMLDFSLEKISLGGIFDHLEGGFFRYSTDNKWRVPHFEKMLYG